MGFKKHHEAYGLMRDIRSSEFLVAFHVCRFFFAFTKDIAQLLQGSSMDVFTACTSIDDARQCIQAARDSAEKCFAIIYQEVTDSTNTIGAGEVTARSNHPSSSPEEYWRWSMFNSFADFLHVELKECFSQLTTSALFGITLLPVNAVKPDGIRENIVRNLQTVFSTDLPCQYSLPQEVQQWVCKWKKEEPEQLPKTVSETLSAVNELAFPNITCISSCYWLHQLHLLLSKGQTLLLHMWKPSIGVQWVRPGWTV